MSDLIHSQDAPVNCNAHVLMSELRGLQRFEARVTQLPIALP
jgi:hypothetical protein